MSNRTAIYQCLADAKGVWPRSAEPSQVIDLWCKLLDGMDPDAIREAFLVHMREERFAPRPADIASRASQGRRRGTGQHEEQQGCHRCTSGRVAFAWVADDESGHRLVEAASACECPAGLRYRNTHGDAGVLAQRLQAGVANGTVRMWMSQPTAQQITELLAQAPRRLPGFVKRKLLAAGKDPDTWVYECPSAMPPVAQAIAAYRRPELESDARARREALFRAELGEDFDPYADQPAPAYPYDEDYR